METTLAFIVTCFLSGDLQGQCYVSIHPEECRPTMDEIFDWAEEEGYQVYVVCDYTPAPIESQRPPERPSPFAMRM